MVIREIFESYFKRTMNRITELSGASSGVLGEVNCCGHESPGVRLASGWILVSHYLLCDVGQVLKALSVSFVTWKTRRITVLAHSLWGLNKILKIKGLEEGGHRRRLLPCPSLQPHTRVSAGIRSVWLKGHVEIEMGHKWWNASKVEPDPTDIESDYPMPNLTINH